MRRHITIALLGLAITATVLADNSGSSRTGSSRTFDADEVTLQGTWQVVSANVNGDIIIARMDCFYWTFRDGIFEFSSPKDSWRSSYELVSTKAGRGIIFRSKDWPSNRGVSLIKFQGDRLELCSDPLGDGANIPAAFDSNNKRWVWVLHRVDSLPQRQ